MTKFKFVPLYYAFEAFMFLLLVTKFLVAELELMIVHSDQVKQLNKLLAFQLKANSIVHRPSFTPITKHQHSRQQPPMNVRIPRAMSQSLLA